MSLDVAVLSFVPFNWHFLGCQLVHEFYVVKSFVCITLCDSMRMTLQVYAACVHACVCRWDFCPPSQLPTETNQAESCQAARLVSTESLAELLTQRISRFP